jgi:methylthioribose-1-phosphate isomerase
MPVETIRWSDGQLTIIDQTQLPGTHTRITLANIDDVWGAIKQLKVRGAPAIGVCAAFGVVVALKARVNDLQNVAAATQEAADYLATSRPTAVNLFWALDRMRRRAESLPPSSTCEEGLAALEKEAVAIFEEDRALCRAIGEHGAALIEEGAGILTHCNAGALATSDYGTALATMYVAADRGRQFHVYADETRPLLQGARLTAWELTDAGIPVTVICDNMAAQVMREGRISMVIVGADRIAANGDVANKIGTYGLAVLAKAHGIPFYVAAPSSTFDLSIQSGEDIPIEQRDAEEVRNGFGRRTAPEAADVYNPAFDVTPAELIAGIVTEHGILIPPYTESIQRHLAE